MPKRRSNDEEDAGPLPASEWEHLPPNAKACRELGHAWPTGLAVEYFHVERKPSRVAGRRGRAVGLERRLPCERKCGSVKVTPYVMVRGWPTPDITRRSTVRYKGRYRLKREFDGQQLPTKTDWAASRLFDVPGLAELLAG